MPEKRGIKMTDLCRNCDEPIHEPYEDNFCSARCFREAKLDYQDEVRNDPSE